MIELYHSTHSTCSQKARICLAEKGLAWTGHHLNLRRFDQLKPKFLALNPAGLAPMRACARAGARRGPAAFRQTTRSRPLRA
jgi:hypothetical protein